MLADKNTLDETGIKIRFNKLCRQFENNKKYEPMTDKEQTIPDDEDLSYEMTVNNKRYEAVFYQISPLDTVAIYNESKQSLLDKYTQEQLDNPTEEISAAIRLNYRNNRLDIGLQNLFAMTNNFVWFMITEHAGNITSLCIMTMNTIMPMEKIYNYKPNKNKRSFFSKLRLLYFMLPIVSRYGRQNRHRGIK